MTNSIAPPRLVTVKANVAIVEDDLIILIDPVEDTCIHGAFMAIAQDDAIWLQEPSPQSDHILNNNHHALIALAHIEPINLITSTQSCNLEQALADSLQQTSHLNQVFKDFMGQAITQIVQYTINLHSCRKGEQLASKPHNTFNSIPACSTCKCKVHKHQYTVPKAGYHKGCQLGQLTCNITLDKGVPTYTHAIQLNTPSSIPSLQIALHLAYNTHAAMHNDNVCHIILPDRLQLQTAGHTCIIHADGTFPKSNIHIATNDFAQVKDTPHIHCLV